MEKYLKIKELFEKNQNSQNAIKMSAYMRNLFEFYGLETPVRRAICKDFLKAELKNKSIDWIFIDDCYKDEHREFQYLAVDYLTKMNRFAVYEDLEKIKSYIQIKPWWDTIDKYAKDVVGNVASRDSKTDELMLIWSVDENFWVRRTAVLHQLCRKEKTNTELLEQIILNNFGSNEFFINKAIGWCLRDYSKTNPDWVRIFIQKHKDEMSKLSVKEASKYI